MPWFLCSVLGDGSDAEFNRFRPALADLAPGWRWDTTGDLRPNSTVAGGGPILVRAAHHTAYDGRVGVEPMRKAALTALGLPDEGEVDDWETPDLAKKIARLAILRQILGIDALPLRAATRLSGFPLDRIRLRLASYKRGLRLDGIGQSHMVGDALLVLLPQIRVKLEPGERNPGGTFTDNFNGAGATTNLESWTPSGGTAWTRVDGTAGMARVNTSGDLDCNTSDGAGAAYQCDDQGNANHYTQSDIINIPGGAGGFVACTRISSRDDYIGANAFNTTSRLFRKVATTFTQMGSDVTIASFDTIRLESDGDDLHAVYLNGSASASTSATHAHNNTITRQGIVPRSVVRTRWIDNFEAGLLAAPADLTATDFDNDRIFQRAAGGTTKTITFSGSYNTAAPASIEIQILNASDSSVAQAWTALSSATIAGGSWSGSLSVPQGGWYHFEARSKDSGGNVLGTVAETANEWAVGVLVAMIGQSNMRNMWSTRSSPPADDTQTKRHAGAGWYAPDLTRQGSETSSNQGVNDFGGNGAVVFGNQLRAGLGLPVGMLQFAIGGTTISTWASGQSSFNNFSSATVGVARSDVGSDFEFVLWHQGENDAVSGTTKANYKTGLDNVYSACRTLTGRSTTTLKFGVALLGNINDGTATDATTDPIRQAQLEWIRDTTGAFFAGSSVDMVRTDTVHWTAPYYERMGRRYAQAILKQLAIQTWGAEGPKIASATRRAGSADIFLTVTHNGGSSLEETDGSTDGGSLTGFEVSDDDFSTTLTISSTAFDGGRVKLTLSAAPASSATIKVRYQYGENPTITNVVYDDQTPQSDTIGFPLQPTIGSVEATLVSSTRRRQLAALRRSRGRRK